MVAKRSTSDARAAKERTVCRSLWRARIAEKRRVDIIISFQIEAVDEAVEDSHVVHTASLVAVAGSEDHHFDRERPADATSALRPGPVGKRAVVALAQRTDALG